MANNHNHLHRRHARDAFPDPVASAIAAADAWADGQAKSDPPQTLVSYVYVTASKTFAGPVGGYSTIGPQPTSSNAAPSAPSAITVDTSSQSSSIAADTTLTTSSTGTPASSSSTLTTSTLPPTSILTASPISSTASSTPSAASLTSNASSSSGGMSTGGKAGLAIGLLLLIGGVLAIILFYFKKRRGAVKTDRLDDEKTAEAFGGAGRQASTRTTANAPRLSLRPVTQFLPNLGVSRQSRGNALAMASTPVFASTEPRKTTGTERPTLTQDSNRNNPFGNHAEAIDSTNANGPIVVDSVSPGGELVAAAAATDATAVAVGLTRGASKRENAPKPIDFTKGGPFRGPPSPAGTEFSMSSEPAGTQTQTPQGAAIAAAGGPANSTVHRVQLDFKPSMDDELALRAGQLIRLLHEYDDGWVTYFLLCYLLPLLIYFRLCAFVSIALNKVLFHARVFLLGL